MKTNAGTCASLSVSLLKVYYSKKKLISQNYSRRVVYLYTSYFGYGS